MPTRGAINHHRVSHLKKKVENLIFCYTLKTDTPNTFFQVQTVILPKKLNYVTLLTVVFTKMFENY